MQIQVLLPSQSTVELEQLPELLPRPDNNVEPFSDEILQACANLSQRIMRDPQARRYPELLALGFWMRKAELIRLREEFRALERTDRILVPRGVIFHLPPRNVDTMFVYSWLLAALTGNANVMRLSPQRSEATNVLLRLFAEGLAETPAILAQTLVVSYGHEEEPTRLLSSHCDVRVIWGGDKAVQSIRSAPLPPHGRELTFPDRYSSSALGTGPYMALDAAGRDKLADQFFNDAFWFDQAGCSSPRLVVWVGGREATAEASVDFFTRVAEVVRRRNYMLSPAHSIQKLVFSAAATLDLPVTACRRVPELTVLTLDSLERFDRRHPGGGLFFEVTVGAITELAPYLIRRDQTLATFGVDAQDLRTLLRQLNGRALDRVVPIGQALQFGRFWDGMDLLQEFCRHLYLAPEVGWR